jgi:uncharacterized protein (TIGR02996 family)
VGDKLVVDLFLLAIIGLVAAIVRVSWKDRQRIHELLAREDERAEANSRNERDEAGSWYERAEASPSHERVRASPSWEVYFLCNDWEGRGSNLPRTPRVAAHPDVPDTGHGQSHAANDRDSFLTAILANPGDDTPRLVYADWLAENGQEEYGEFIRLQCVLARWGVASATAYPVRHLCRHCYSTWLLMPAGSEPQWILGEPTYSPCCETGPAGALIRETSDTESVLLAREAELLAVLRPRLLPPCPVCAGGDTTEGEAGCRHCGATGVCPGEVWRGFAHSLKVPSLVTVFEMEVGEETASEGGVSDDELTAPEIRTQPRPWATRALADFGTVEEVWVSDRWPEMWTQMMEPIWLWSKLWGMEALNDNTCLPELVFNALEGGNDPNEGGKSWYDPGADVALARAIPAVIRAQDCGGSNGS